MAKRPKRVKEPAEPAVEPAEVTTFEGADASNGGGKDSAAQSLGRRGGKARAEKMTAERRSEIAKTAAKSRWKR